jgi:hypothetical protein
MLDKTQGEQNKSAYPPFADMGADIAQRCDGPEPDSVTQVVGFERWHARRPERSWPDRRAERSSSDQ